MRAGELVHRLGAVATLLDLVERVYENLQQNRPLAPAQSLHFLAAYMCGRGHVERAGLHCDCDFNILPQYGIAYLSAAT
jgi:hypothetical protein